MGTINVETLGSFQPHKQRSFSAMDYGHAAAVAAVIGWLAEDVLPAAIEQDHALQGEAEKPRCGWGKEKEKHEQEG